MSKHQLCNSSNIGLLERRFWCCQGRKKFVLGKNCKSPTFESKNIYGLQIHLKNCSFTEFERFSKNIAESAKTNSSKIVRDGKYHTFKNSTKEQDLSKSVNIPVKVLQRQLYL